MKYRYLFFWIFMLFITLPGLASVSIQEEKQDGEPVVVIENNYYRTVLAPTIARMPLSYYFKLTEHEQFIHPEEKIKKDRASFHYFGGIIDSIPSVSGIEDWDRKGYLWRVPWKSKIGKGRGWVKYTGEAVFNYKDPVSNEEYKLKFTKIITGYEGTSCLRMDYRIENIGDNQAKFMFSAHSRTGIGGSWNTGDYFWAPGEKCRFYYSDNYPAYKDTKEGAWLPWPLKEATDFVLKEDKHQDIFVFLPSNWCVVGDNNTKETLFFVSSPIKIGKRKDMMKMGIFMATDGYVVEPCLTYYIGYQDWKKPEATIGLNSGEVCAFTLYMTAYKGVTKEQVQNLKGANSNCLLLEPPLLRRKENKDILELKVVVPGEGRLFLEKIRMKRKSTIATIEMEAGINEVEKEFPMLKKGEELLLLWMDNSGKSKLAVLKSNEKNDN